MGVAKERSDAGKQHIYKPSDRCAVCGGPPGAEAHDFHPPKRFPLKTIHTVDGTEYKTEVTLQDDLAVRYFICPNCGLRGMIDDDQFFGRVSIDCPNCPFHETLALAEATPTPSASPENPNE